MKRRRRREGEESEAKVLQENKPKPSPTYNDDTRTVGGTFSPLRLAFICLHRWLSICLSFLTLFKNLLSFYCKLPQVIIDFDGGGCRKSNSCLCFLIKVQCSVVKYSRKNTSETVNTGWTLNKPPPLHLWKMATAHGGLHQRPRRAQQTARCLLVGSSTLTFEPRFLLWCQVSPAAGVARNRTRPLEAH